MEKMPPLIPKKPTESASTQMSARTFRSSWSRQSIISVMKKIFETLVSWSHASLGYSAPSLDRRHTNQKARSSQTSLTFGRGLRSRAKTKPTKVRMATSMAHGTWVRTPQVSRCGFIKPSQVQPRTPIQGRASDAGKRASRTGVRSRARITRVFASGHQEQDALEKAYHAFQVLDGRGQLRRIGRW